MNRTEQVIKILQEYSQEHPSKAEQLEELINELYVHGCRRLVDE